MLRCINILYFHVLFYVSCKFCKLYFSTFLSFLGLVCWPKRPHRMVEGAVGVGVGVGVVVVVVLLLLLLVLLLLLLLILLLPPLVLQVLVLVALLSSHQQDDAIHSVSHDRFVEGKGTT